MRPSTQGIRVFASVLVACGCALAAGGASSDAASTGGTVVGADILTATELDVDCDAQAAWSFGPVASDSSNLTAVDGDACAVSFGSSNSTATLQVVQPDRAGTAMGAAGGSTVEISFAREFHDVAARSASVAVAVGNRGVISRTDDGSTWQLVVAGSGVNSTLSRIDHAAGQVFVAVGALGRIIVSPDDGASFGSQVSGVSERLMGIDAFDASNWIAVGEDGRVLHTSTAGVGAPGWNIGVSGTTADLRAVVSTSALDAIAVGDAGTALVTADGGATWNPMPTPPPAGGADLRAVDIAPDGTILIGGVNGLLLRSTTGGATWTTPTSGLGTATVEDIVAATNTSAHLVGGSDGAAFQRSIDGGASWAPVARRGTREQLQGVSSSDGAAVFAAGGGHTVVGAPDATTFEAQSEGWESIRDMRVWDDGRIVTVGAYGQLRRSDDDGATWDIATLPAMTDTLNGVAFDDADRERGIAVGDGGRVLVTNDGGASWSIVASPTAQTLRAVAFSHEGTAWAVGDAGTVLRTTSAGASWSGVAVGTAQNLYAVSAPRADVLWVSGPNGTIVRSVDAGETWAPPTSPGSSSYPLRVAALDAQRAVVAHGSDLYQTLDGGSTWTTRPITSMTVAMDVSALSPHALVVVGTVGRVRTTVDSGVTWTTAGTGGTIWTAQMLDASAVYEGGDDGLGLRAGATPVPDWSPGVADWSTAPSGMFAGCLQELANATEETWTEDATNAVPQCEVADTASWNAVTTAPAPVASTTSIGDVGTATFVWGFRATSTMSAGNYRATVGFEVLAP